MALLWEVVRYEFLFDPFFLFLLFKEHRPQVHLLEQEGHFHLVASEDLLRLFQRKLIGLPQKIVQYLLNTQSLNTNCSTSFDSRSISPALLFLECIDDSEHSSMLSRYIRTEIYKTYLDNTGFRYLIIVFGTNFLLF
jgi:hypothetical protein